MSDDALIRSLRATRAGYEDELRWHRFLLDAYAGTGGFAGRIAPNSAGYWGPASEIYSRNAVRSQDGDGAPVNTSSYLDRYPREDSRKFQRRTEVAQYPNFVEQIVDLRLSYLSRKPMQYAGVEPLQSEDAVGSSFFEDTGNGLSWERLMHDVMRLRASVCGWAPLMFDMRSIDAEISVEQAREAGVRPRAIPLWPANLLDWQLDEDGDFEWVKIVNCYTERPDPLGETVRVERITIWTDTESRVWEIEEREGKPSTIRVRDDMREHGWGQVPIVIFRCRPKTDDNVRGISMVTSIAPLARRLFNYLSELDEHLRASTFAMLQYPVKGDPKKMGTVPVGAGNALAIPHDSSRDIMWLSPDAGVATVYEARVHATIESMHRIARMRFMSGVQTQASGVAQSYEFQDLERAISDTALAFASGEREALQLVLRMNGAAENIASAVRVTPPARFDVEDLSKQIDETMRATSLGLGPSADGEIKKRLVRQLLPNLDDDILAAIDAEIEQREEEAEQAAAAMLTMGAAGDAGQSDESPTGENPTSSPEAGQSASSTQGDAVPPPAARRGAPPPKAKKKRKAPPSGS